MNIKIKDDTEIDMSHRTWIRSCGFAFILSGAFLGGCDSASDDLADDSEAVAVEESTEVQIPSPNDLVSNQFVPSTQQTGVPYDQSQLATQPTLQPTQVNQQESEAQYLPLPALPEQTVIVHPIEPIAQEPSSLDPSNTNFGAHNENASVSNEAHSKPYEPIISEKMAQVFKVQERELTLNTNLKDRKTLSTASKPDGELAAAAQSSQAILQYGMQLAERGAAQSARGEFVKSFEIAIRGLDNQKNTTVHQQCYLAGTKAIEEVEDLLPGDSARKIDVEGTVAIHKTQIIANEELSDNHAKRSRKTIPRLCERSTA